MNDGDLRDYIAIAAMQGELSSQDYVNVAWPSEKDLADRAYDLAEAMMNERQKRKTEK